MALDLTPARALIFRIVHRDNVDWLLGNGVHCPNSAVKCPSYVQIGNPDLIDKRSRRRLPRPPGGMLSDYAPFYFTPASPMLYNIKTGYGGIRQRSNEEIVIFVSSLNDLHSLGLKFVFSDRHANLETARFSSNTADLEWLDWERLRNKDFKRHPDHPEWFEQYQAEALVERVLPASALRGLACYNDSVKHVLSQMVEDHGLSLPVVKMPGWYF